MAGSPDIRRLDLSRLRLEYSRHSLSEDRVDRDPIRQFLVWFEECLKAETHEPNAMTLATCDASGAPAARIVLLKGVDERGFVFYTNYQSRKGRALAENPRAAIVFYWPELERQVSAEGSVEKTSEADADVYFASRPRESQIGSAASPQSQVIESRQLLEEQARAIQQQYPTGNIPRPPHWGGYRLTPSRIEFWQGRPSRLHDRIEYLLNDAGRWEIRRLAP